MPVSYRIFPSRSLALTIASGRVSSADARSHLKTLFGDPEWQPGFRHLIDCTRVRTIDATTVELRALAGLALMNAERQGGGRVAVVAPTDFVFGISRMYEAFSGAMPRSLKVFRELAPAMRWLEAPGEEWADEVEAEVRAGQDESEDVAS